jgi:perosamine synthetase
LEKIPLHKPQNTVNTEVLEAVQEVLESGWLTQGPKTDEFERVFADYVGSKYGIATSSCTAALYLALDSIGIKKGASVVVPVNTFVATANVVRWFGAEPVFCDIDTEGEIDVAKLADLLETHDNIECVIPVHLYGFPCNINEISRLVRKHGVKMVEDCAQSHGATVEGKKVGSFGDVGCFSFYATKNITFGEGGILVTNNKKVRNKAILLRSHGQSKTPREKITNWHYDVTNLGFNFRLSEIEAAIGLKQMEKIDLITNSRREIARKYKEELMKIPGIQMLHDPSKNLKRQSVYHMLEVRVEKPYPLKRDALHRYLEQKGITAGVHYTPIHYFSYYRKTTKYKKGDFPNAEDLSSKILSLPIFPFMTDIEFQKIIGTLKAGSRRD